MLSIVSIGLRRIAVGGKYLLASLLVLLVISGCGTQWFPDTLEADPAVIGEVRDIGNQMAHATTGLIYEYTTQNIDILILDVGASSSREAFNVAQDRLRQRGWVVTGKADDVINMNSKKWEHISVLIKSMKSLESYGVTQEPQIAKVLKASPTESAAYVVLAVTPYN